MLQVKINFLWETLHSLGLVYPFMNYNPWVVLLSFFRERFAFTEILKENSEISFQGIRIKYYKPETQKRPLISIQTLTFQDTDICFLGPCFHCIRDSIVPCSYSIFQIYQESMGRENHSAIRNIIKS